MNHHFYNYTRPETLSSVYPIKVRLEYDLGGEMFSVFKTTLPTFPPLPNYAPGL